MYVHVQLYVNLFWSLKWLPECLFGSMLENKEHFDLTLTLNPHTGHNPNPNPRVRA
jgi:hypothetical protein